MIRPARHTTILQLALLAITLTLLSTCTRDKAAPTTPINTDRFPPNIKEIMLTECAISGCHNEASKGAAANLGLYSWDALFEGSRSGAVIIPYRADQSWVNFFINTYDDLGISIEPTMPFNRSPLTRQEVITIQDWINAGAPDIDGNIKFADQTGRRKVYLANQGCDIVTVIDAQTKLAMRYVNIGAVGSIEAPHTLKVSPDRARWYVVFTAGEYLQQFDAETDSLAAELHLGPGSWNTMAISSDGKTGFVVDWAPNGQVVRVNLETMEETARIAGTGLLIWPHGIAYHEAAQTLYVTGQTGNFYYKIDISNIVFPEVEMISLEPGVIPDGLSKLDPHEVLITPDGSKYLFTCEKSNEIRFFSTANDSLLAIVNTPTHPQEASFSTTSPYVFITCTEADCAEPKCKGAVLVVNYETMTAVKTLQDGLFQPHGIAVDDEAGLVYVASRNTNPSGPAPHHSSDCGGRNGYFQLIDLNTLEILPDFKAEVSVDPYSFAIR